LIVEMIFWKTSSLKSKRKYLLILFIYKWKYLQNKMQDFKREITIAVKGTLKIFDKWSSDMESTL
jgi:hypothetical protein